MISTEALTKKYGKLTALSGLDLNVAEGEIFGLIGPNGAGKSTTLKILATLLRPTSGTATVGGFKLPEEGAKVRGIIGYMPDFAGAYEDMRVDEYLAFFAAAYGITGKKARGVIGDVLELTDLAEKKEELVESLSRGMTQRLGIARVLLHDPKVLLLDEPASGLDPRARVEMRMLLKELAGMNKTVVISSHILFELAELCTTVGIIERGELLYKGSVQELVRLCRRADIIHAKVGGEENLRKAVELLATDGRVAEAVVKGELLEVRLASPETAADFVAEKLVGAGLPLHYLSEEPVTLEDAFMRLTKGQVG